MANATIAIDRLEALQITRDLAAKVTLKHPFVLGDDVEDFVQLLLGEVLRPHVGIQATLLDEQIGTGGTDAVDVTEGIRDFLFRGDFYTEETWHGCLG